MSWLQANRRLFWGGGLVVVICTYLFSRLWQSQHFPLFIDEGVYLWYAESVLRGDWMRGFGEGKPLVGWGIALPMALGVDPIWSARLPFVFAGIVGVSAATTLAYSVGGRLVALIAAGLCLILPALVAHERMATPDIGMGALGTLALWLALQAFRRSAWWTPAAGLALIAAVLAKSPVGLFFYLGPCLFFWAERRRGLRPARRRLLLVYILPMLFLATAAALVISRLRAGAYPPGFGLHEVFAKTTGDADLVARTQTNLAILGAWLRADGNWLFALLVVVGAALAWRSRHLHVVVLALMVALWWLLMLVTATFLPERYWTPVFYLAAVVAGWSSCALASRSAQWLRLRPPRAQTAFWIALSMLLLVLAAFMLPADWAMIDVTAEERQLYQAQGLPAAANFLSEHLRHEDAQVVLLHVGDYTRLKAYLPADLAGRVRQVHLIDRQSQDTAAQMEHLAAWVKDTPFTYVVTELVTAFDARWQARFPQAELVAEFTLSASDSATQIWRLAQP